MTVIDHAQRAKMQAKLRKYTRAIDIDALARRHGVPLLIVDVDLVRQQYRLLQQHLPGIKHHYALKALELTEIISAIRDEGGYLDLATQGEIELALSVGFPIDRCMHTHPIKKPEEIRQAYDAGLRRFVVDNPYELAKFAGYGPEVELMIRLAHHDAEATVDLAYKFGAQHDGAVDLVAQALKQGNTVAGFCMHVGSQTHNPAAYAEAIERTVQLVDEVEARHDVVIKVLDIGGGFPVEYREFVPSVTEIASVVMPLLKPLSERFELLAEPGRFIVGPAGTMVVSVVGRAERHGELWYYVDDGVYGCYSNQVFEQIVPHFFALQELLGDDDMPHESVTLAGPTCDSVDVLAKHYPLPQLDQGDLIVSPSMGSYTHASATTFNAIPRPNIALING